jgi:hypothetical protein
MAEGYSSVDGAQVPTTLCYSGDSMHAHYMYSEVFRSKVKCG